MAVAPELERIPCFAFSRYRMERELSLSSVKRSNWTAPSFRQSDGAVGGPEIYTNMRVEWKTRRGYYGAGGGACL